MLMKMMRKTLQFLPHLFVTIFFRFSIPFLCALTQLCQLYERKLSVCSEKEEEKV